MPPATPHTGRPARWLKLLVILLFTVYFLAVSWDGLKAGFAADDMQAIYTYWHPSPLRLLASQVMLWRGYFRPMNGVFYMPVFLTRGLDPKPYHVALLVLLWIGVWQLYRLARSLGADELTAACAALIACYHGGLANLYYNTVYVGDAMCGVFYWGALAMYARVRREGRAWSGGRLAGFGVLYLCALNSKEMALTLPGILLAYEWIFHGAPPLRPKEISGWLRGPARALCLASLLDLVSFYGKAFGSLGLMHNPAYRPVYSWARVVDFQERYLSNMLYQPDRISGFATCVIWLVLTYLVWRRRRPILRFCWVYVLLAPLPVEFIIGRDQANLYVTLAGWAILAATLFTDWLKSATRVMASEPLVGRLGPRRLHAVLAGAGMLALAWWSWSYEATWIASTIPKLSPLTNEVIAQFRAMNPHVHPGAKVIFLNDPWPGGFDMEFVAELWFKDRHTVVHLCGTWNYTPEEIATHDAVFSWKDGALLRIR